LGACWRAAGTLAQTNDPLGYTELHAGDDGK
jgi:hypothetical protein